VERTVGYIKHQFWPGVTFTDLADLNRQALIWCERINGRVHRTTHMRPVDRHDEEALRPLPEGFAWERFATEERKVTWDGYVSYEGVLYGVPASARLAGRRVQVREQQGLLTIWSAGHLLCRHPLQAPASRPVAHPQQWAGVPSAQAAAQRPVPVGYQVTAPPIQQRTAHEYDQYLGERR